MTFKRGLSPLTLLLDGICFRRMVCCGILEEISWQTIPYIANISEAVARLPKAHAIGVAHRPAGTLHSRLIRIKNRIDQSEQPLIIYRAQCMDCSSKYTGQTSKKLATRAKAHWSALRNCDLKTSLMASHFVDTGHIFDLDETNILSHTNSWTTRLFKEAWLSSRNSINKCIELPQACSVLRAAIE